MASILILHKTRLPEYKIMSVFCYILPTVNTIHIPTVQYTHLPPIIHTIIIITLHKSNNPPHKSLS